MQYFSFGVWSAIGNCDIYDTNCKAVCTAPNNFIYWQAASSNHSCGSYTSDCVGNNQLATTLLYTGGSIYFCMKRDNTNCTLTSPPTINGLKFVQIGGVWMYQCVVVQSSQCYTKGNYQCWIYNLLVHSTDYFIQCFPNSPIYLPYQNILTSYIKNMPTMNVIDNNGQCQVSCPYQHPLMMKVWDGVPNTPQFRSIYQCLAACIKTSAYVCEGFNSQQLGKLVTCNFAQPTSYYCVENCNGLTSGYTEDEYNDGSIKYILRCHVPCNTGILALPAYLSTLMCVQSCPISQKYKERVDGEFQCIDTCATKYGFVEPQSIICTKCEKQPYNGWIMSSDSDYECYTPCPTKLINGLNTHLDLGECIDGACPSSAKYWFQVASQIFRCNPQNSMCPFIKLTNLICTNCSDGWIYRLDNTMHACYSNCNLRDQSQVIFGIPRCYQIEGYCPDGASLLSNQGLYSNCVSNCPQGYVNSQFVCQTCTMTQSASLLDSNTQGYKSITINSTTALMCLQCQLIQQVGIYQMCVDQCPLSQPLLTQWQYPNASGQFLQQCIVSCSFISQYDYSCVSCSPSNIGGYIIITPEINSQQSAISVKRCYQNCPTQFIELDEQNLQKCVSQCSKAAPFLQFIVSNFYLCKNWCKFTQIVQLTQSQHTQCKNICDDAVIVGQKEGIMHYQCVECQLFGNIIYEGLRECLDSCSHLQPFKLIQNNGFNCVDNCNFIDSSQINSLICMSGCSYTQAGYTLNQTNNSIEYHTCLIKCNSYINKFQTYLSVPKCVDSCEAPWNYYQMNQMGQFECQEQCLFQISETNYQCQQQCQGSLSCFEQLSVTVYLCKQNCKLVDPFVTYRGVPQEINNCTNRIYDVYSTIYGFSQYFCVDQCQSFIVQNQNNYNCSSQCPDASYGFVQLSLVTNTQSNLCKQCKFLDQLIEVNGVYKCLSDCDNSAPLYKVANFLWQTYFCVSNCVFVFVNDQNNYQCVENCPIGQISFQQIDFPVIDQQKQCKPNCKILDFTFKFQLLYLCLSECPSALPYLWQFFGDYLTCNVSCPYVQQINAFTTLICVDTCIGVFHGLIQIQMYGKQMYQCFYKCPPQTPFYLLTLVQTCLDSCPNQSPFYTYLSTTDLLLKCTSTCNFVNLLENKYFCQNQCLGSNLGFKSINFGSTTGYLCIQSCTNINKLNTYKQLFECVDYLNCDQDTPFIQKINEQFICVNQCPHFYFSYEPNLVCGDVCNAQFGISGYKYNLVSSSSSIYGYQCFNETICQILSKSQQYQQTYQCVDQCSSQEQYFESRGQQFVCTNSCQFIKKLSTGQLQCQQSCKTEGTINGLSYFVSFGQTALMCTYPCPQNQRYKQLEMCSSECSQFKQLIEQSSGSYFVYQCLEFCQFVIYDIMEGYICSDCLQPNGYLTLNSLNLCTQCELINSQQMIDNVYQCVSECPNEAQVIKNNMCVTSCSFVQLLNNRYYCNEHCQAPNGYYQSGDFLICEQCTTQYMDNSSFDTVNAAQCMQFCSKFIQVLNGIKWCVDDCVFSNKSKYCIECSSTFVEPNYCYQECPPQFPLIDLTQQYNYVPKCVKQCQIEQLFVKINTCTEICTQQHQYQWVQDVFVRVCKNCQMYINIDIGQECVTQCDGVIYVISLFNVECYQGNDKCNHFSTYVQPRIFTENNNCVSSCQKFVTSAQQCVSLCEYAFINSQQGGISVNLCWDTFCPTTTYLSQEQQLYGIPKCADSCIEYYDFYEVAFCSLNCISQMYKIENQNRKVCVSLQNCLFYIQNTLKQCLLQCIAPYQFILEEQLISQCLLECPENYFYEENTCTQVCSNFQYNLSFVCQNCQFQVKSAFNKDSFQCVDSCDSQYNISMYGIPTTCITYEQALIECNYLWNGFCNSSCTKFIINAKECVDECDGVVNVQICAQSCEQGFVFKQTCIKSCSSHYQFVLGAKCVEDCLQKVEVGQCVSECSVGDGKFCGIQNEEAIAIGAAGQQNVLSGAQVATICVAVLIIVVEVGLILAYFRYLKKGRANQGIKQKKQKKVVEQQLTYKIEVK